MTSLKLSAAMKHPNVPTTTRRSFLKSTGAALAAAPFVLPNRVRAQYSADTLKVGLIGCGGRGTGAAKQALKADKNVVLVALGDVFENRLGQSLSTLKADSEVQKKVDVDPEQCFIGFDAYQKVIDSGVDVVILATPPGFRPGHLKAAIEANKHVFCEKPMAVDAPGVRSVLATAEEAKRRDRALVAGFCWRYNPAERSAFEKIHEGAIGDVRAVHGTYLTGSLWSKPRQAGWTDMEWQIRNWLYFTWLSGDHLVEQAVHTVDKMSWAMKDQKPLRAVAMGGRLVRTGAEFGHIYDHFAVTYEYPDDARAFIFCRQQPNCYQDNSDAILGTKGTARIKAFGPISITGENPWRIRSRQGLEDMYQVEHNELFASIRAGKPINDGAWMAQSTMLAIMGRMAAYTGKEVTWEQAIDSKEDLLPPRLDWDLPRPVSPVALPGQKELV